MKKIILTIMAACTLWGCKPTEANYRAAYEIAKQKKEQQNEAVPEGASLQKYDMPSEMIVNGDTLMILKTYVSPVEDGAITRETMKRYNLVVGQFKQVFNARQMQKRLSANGYPEAGILKVRSQDYLVISNPVSTTEEVKAALIMVEKDTMLNLREPLPFILVPSTFAIR